MFQTLKKRPVKNSTAWYTIIMPDGLRIDNIMDPEKDRFPEKEQGSGLTAFVSRLFKMDLT